MPRPWARWRPYPLAVLTLCPLALGDAAAVASEVPTAGPRFAGLERLYFERLDDPAAATSSIRRGGEVSPLAEDVRRLLPAALAEGEGATVGERAIEPSIGPIGFGLSILDLPLPEAVAGAGVFLRQVVDGTHPRIHEQFWALYAGGRRTDLWFFSPTPDRTDSKLVAPLQVEEVRQPDESSLLLRVSGAMIRPQGAGWFQGVDLHFSVDGTELRYRHAVRRYSFTYGYDLGSGSSALVSVEIPRQQDGRTVLEQRLFFDVPNELAGECGVDPEYDFPSGTFDEMAAIAACITSSPGAETRWREVDEPTFIERGGRPMVEARVLKGLPEASLDPPSDAVELCSGEPFRCKPATPSKRTRKSPQSKSLSKKGSPTGSSIAASARAARRDAAGSAPSLQAAAASSSATVFNRPLSSGVTRSFKANSARRRSRSSVAGRSGLG